MILPDIGPSIGIVGGMGPHAGLDLFGRLLERAHAARDQDHLPVLLASYPGRIPDRTSFLLGEQDANPAGAIASVALSLARAGAIVAGIPCNTAHAPAILDVVLAHLAREAPELQLVNMVAETAAVAADLLRPGATVGILGTAGVRYAGVYPAELAGRGLAAVVPTDREQDDLVSRAIFDPRFGIKSGGSRIAPESSALLERAAEALVHRGATAVVLGCTEIPLAIKSDTLAGVPVLDPNEILARTLVREFEERAAQ